MKFRRNESDNGCGYGDDFTVECFGRDNSEIEDDKCHGREVFLCIHCEGDVEDDILTERILGNFQVPLCGECLDPSNKSCGIYFQGTRRSGMDYEQYSP